MKGKPIQNLAASVYARLLKRTELGDEDFQFVLMRYGAERLMYWLSQSEHATNFVLKGAMMFLVWTGAQYRATKDMDLLALKSASVERLQDISEADAIAEGLQGDGIMYYDYSPEGTGVPTQTPRSSYCGLWDSINGKRFPWASNPWVWALTFRRIR